MTCAFSPTPSAFIELAFTRSSQQLLFADVLTINTDPTYSMNRHHVARYASVACLTLPNFALVPCEIKYGVPNWRQPNGPMMQTLYSTG